MSEERNSKSFVDVCVQVVTNWTAPLAFRRLWCVWEVFIAERASLPVFMVQPDQEEEALLTNLIDRGISSATNPIAKQGWQKANIGKPNSTMVNVKEPAVKGTLKP